MHFIRRISGGRQSCRQRRGVIDAQHDPAETVALLDRRRFAGCVVLVQQDHRLADAARSEEHTSELQSLMRSSYAVFCLKKKTNRLSSEIRREVGDCKQTTNTKTHDYIE